MAQKQTKSQRKQAAKKRAKAQAEFQKGRPKKYIYKDGKKVEVKETPETDKNKTFDQSAHRPKGGLGALAKKNKEDKKKRKQFGCGGRAMAKGGGKANKARLAVRSAVTDMLGWEPGMGPPGDPRALAQHEQFSGMLTSKLMSLGIPSAIAGAVVEGLGNINELGSGLTSVIGGGKLFSPEGIDIMDLQANQKGIAAAKGSRNAPKMSYSSVPRGKKGGRVHGQLGGVGVSRDPIAAPTGRPVPTPPPVGTSLPGLLPGQYPGQPGGPYPVSGNITTGSNQGTSTTDQSGYTQNIADTGVLDNLVTQMSQHQAGGGQDVNTLRGFDPFTGQLGTTQNELLTTGLPTDVSGATEAAKIRAGQEFDASSDKINELLASKGLLSSNARTAAIARERAKMGERIGATGLEAGIAAQEAAAGRRAGAVGAGLAGSGQQLAATQGAGQLDLSRTGQQLAGQQSAAQGAAQSAQMNARTETGGTSTTNTSGQTQGAQTNFGFPGRPGGQIARPMGPSGVMGAAKAGPARPPIASGGFGGLHNNPSAAAGSGYTAMGGNRSLFGAEGGEVPDMKGFERWIDNLGANMLRAWGGEHAALADPDQRREAARNLAIGNLGGMEEAYRLYNDPELQMAAKMEGQRHRSAMRGLPQTTHSPGEDPATTDLVHGFNNLRSMGKGTRLAVSPENSSFWEMRDNETGELIDPVTGEAKNPPKKDPNAFYQEGGYGEVGAGSRNTAGMGGYGADILGVQGSARGREFFQSGGPVNPPNTVPLNRPTANLTDLAIAHPTSAGDPRRKFYQEGGPTGGEVPGEDTGQDKVPAMLRAEELVVTPELVQNIEAVQTPDQAMAVVETLKALAQKPLEYSEDEGEYEAASGGYTAQSSPIEELATYLRSIGVNLPDFSLDPERQEELRGQLPGMVNKSISDPNSAASIFGGAILSPQINQQKPEELVGPPAPSPYQLAMQAVDINDLRDPGYMPMTPPTVPDKAEIVPGYGGAAPTLRARGPMGDQFEGPEQPKRGSVSFLGKPAMSKDELQMARITRAKSRRDLIQHAMIMDPIGGPEKHARLQNALNNADREVEALVNEVVAKEQNRIAERQAAAEEVGAMASLSNATAFRLQAESQKATAYATVAEKLQKLSAMDPQAAMVIEMFSKMTPDTERGAEIAEANLKFLLKKITGYDIRENGWFRRLFSGFTAPQFEVVGKGKPGAVPPDIAQVIQAYGGV